MKKITSLFLFSLSIFFISGCGKEVQESELNFRNNLYYPLNSDSPYSGKIISYYPNSNLKLKSSENYKKGQKNGLSQTWYENGQLMMSLNYIDGILID
tara:strand:+ start:382 stop:675 length:294 start_codon:yes stop_codon:yes gene_type:complete